MLLTKRGVVAGVLSEGKREGPVQSGSDQEGGEKRGTLQNTKKQTGAFGNKEGETKGRVKSNNWTKKRAFVLCGKAKSGGQGL